MGTLQPLLGAPANLGLRPPGPSVHPAFPTHGVSGISRFCQDIFLGIYIPVVRVLQPASSVQGGEGQAEQVSGLHPVGAVTKAPSLCSPRRGRPGGALALPAPRVCLAAARGTGLQRRRPGTGWALGAGGGPTGARSLPHPSSFCPSICLPGSRDLCPLRELGGPHGELISARFMRHTLLPRRPAQAQGPWGRSLRGAQEAQLHLPHLGAPCPAFGGHLGLQGDRGQASCMNGHCVQGHTDSLLEGGIQRWQRGPARVSGHRLGWGAQPTCPALGAHRQRGRWRVGARPLGVTVGQGRGRRHGGCEAGLGRPEGLCWGPACDRQALGVSCPLTEPGVLPGSSACLPHRPDRAPRHPR